MGTLGPSGRRRMQTQITSGPRRVGAADFFPMPAWLQQALGEQSPYVALDFATGCDHELEDVAVGYAHRIADRQYVAVRLLAQGSSLALHGDFAQLCRLMLR